MDSDNDYAVAKDIVQSGHSGEDWDAFRHGKGSWPDDERKSWKQYRNYSLDKLIEMMESYKRTKGISLLNTFHPTFLPHMMAYYRYVRNHFLSASAGQPAYKAQYDQAHQSSTHGKKSIICFHSSLFALFLSFPVYYHLFDVLCGCQRY